MDKLQLLLKENWAILQELFELPKNINTKSGGDDFFNSKGEYGEFFDFSHPFIGKSGKTYVMIFKFNLRSIPQPVNEGGNKEPIKMDASLAPIYEVSFYPSDKEGNAGQWGLLNDIDPTQVVAVAGYYVLYHASQLAKQPVPVPFIKYLVRPYKEAHEKQMDAKDSKRGQFYNRAIPRVIESLAGNFGNIQVTEVTPAADHTMVVVNLAKH
jgi:hypothetical protein